MTRHWVWILVGLIFGGLLGFASMSHADMGKWTKKADMPTARARLSTSAVNGKIYAIGGWKGGFALSTVEEYDTGFAGQGVEAKGKLATLWGKLKAAD